MPKTFKADMNRWLVDDSLKVIQRLAFLAEYRERVDPWHNMRIGQYCHLMARTMGLPEETRQALYYASMLHDIGKLDIPLSILLKPDKLTGEEFDVMKTHTIRGQKALGPSGSDFIKMAERVILTHHENWDGSGYPNALRDDEIPLEGRLVHLADQYDALRSERPYKPAIGHEMTYEIITGGDQKTKPWHFDPELLDLFEELHQEFAKIFDQYRY